MRAARIIWVCWCLLWVLIWLVLAGQQIVATQDCTTVNHAVGMAVRACGGDGPAVGGLVLAAAAGAAIFVPVGRGRT